MGASLDDCANGDFVDVFSTHGTVLFLWTRGWGILQDGMGMVFKDKIMLHCFRQVKR